MATYRLGQPYQGAQRRPENRAEWDTPPKLTDGGFDTGMVHCKQVCVVKRPTQRYP